MKNVFKGYDYYINKHENDNIQNKIDVYKYSEEKFIDSVTKHLCTQFTGFITSINFDTILKKLGHIITKVKRGNYADPEYLNDKHFYKNTTYKSSIKEFINDVIYKNISVENIPYAAKINLDRNIFTILYAEPVIIPYFTKFINPKMWLSKKNTITKLHRDSADNISIQLYGIKKWTLYPPKLSNNLYYNNNPAVKLKTNTQRALVDIKNPNYDIHPLFKKCNGKEMIVMVNAGDILYIPLGWGHEVETISDSISINYWCKQPRTSLDV